VEQYGETDLLKKGEKRVGYTDNRSIMEMERQLRCYDFQHSAQGQEVKVKVMMGKEDMLFLNLLKLIIKTQRRQM
jgi:hypothetical protein